MTRRAWLLFAGVAILWGMPYFFIKIAVAELSPPAVALSRFVLSAILLVPLAWRQRSLAAARRRWPWLVALGTLYLGLALTLIPIAELYISSSLAAIIVAAVPLVVALLSLPWERPTPLELVGLMIGYGGVAMLVGFDFAGRPSELAGAAVMLVVTVLYAAGPIVISRRLGDIPAIGYTSVAMTVAAITLLAPALVFRPASWPSPAVVVAVLTLGGLCTAIPFVMYFRLVREAGPQRASLVTYLNPLVALLLGVAVLHEPLKPATLAGMGLILSGSWLATRHRPPTNLPPRRGGRNQIS